MEIIAMAPILVRSIVKRPSTDFSAKKNTAEERRRSSAVLGATVRHRAGSTIGSDHRDLMSHRRKPKPPDGGAGA